KGRLQAWASGPWNTTAAFLGFEGDEPRVLAGSERKFGDTVTGGLRVLRFSRDRDTKGFAEREVGFVFDRVRYRPLALAPAASQADGRFAYAAAVLQPGRDDLGNVLTLTDLAANPAAVRVRLALKNTDPIHVPVVAAAPRGKWLAVAG